MMLTLSQADKSDTCSKNELRISGSSSKQCALIGKELSAESDSPGDVPHFRQKERKYLCGGRGVTLSMSDPPEVKVN